MYLCVLTKSLLCTHHLSLMHVVSAGVPVSPIVEVGQSGHEALDAVLQDTSEWSGGGEVATGQDNTVC